MTTDPICVRRTNTIEEADIIVAWLEEHGIEASVIDRDNPGVFAFGVTDPEGVAICVADEATAETAKRLLEEHDREHLQQQCSCASEVELHCEECGHDFRVPGEQADGVVECPQCRAHVDARP